MRQWGTPFTAGTWFNFAYDIDVCIPSPVVLSIVIHGFVCIQFSAGTVGLWASTGSAPLTKVVQNIKASTSTNSEDFHVGVLRIVNTPAAEDWFISGVYVVRLLSPHLRHHSCPCCIVTSRTVLSPRALAPVADPALPRRRLHLRRPPRPPRHQPRPRHPRPRRLLLAPCRPSTVSVAALGTLARRRAQVASLARQSPRLTTTRYVVARSILRDAGLKLNTTLTPYSANKAFKGVTAEQDICTT